MIRSTRAAVEHFTTGGVAFLVVAIGLANALRAVHGVAGGLN